MPESEREHWVGTLRGTAEGSEKSWWTALVLSVSLGYFGVDRSYLNQPLLGALKLITFGGFGVWWLFDIALLLSNRMRDGDGGIVRRPS